MLNELIKKAKMVFNTAKLVQQYKINIFETRASDDAERFQDYGFASQPSEGEGLVIDAGGMVMVLRIDRLKERPKLSADEVSVWHKDGHKIHLKSGKKIEVDCDSFVVNASGGVQFNTPKVSATGEVADQKGTMNAIRNSFNDHDHNETNSVTSKPNQEM